MIQAVQANRDRMGLAAITLPLFAVSLYLFGIFSAITGFAILATGLMMTSFIVLFASIPFAGVLALQSRQSNPPRMMKALIGLALGIILSILFVLGYMNAISKARAVQKQLEQQAEQVGDGDAEEAV